MKFGREQVVTIGALVAVYGAFYLCRANVDAAMPLWARTYGYDKEQLGGLASLAILAYAVGKLALGSLADGVGGFYMLVLVIVGSVAASLGIGAVSTLFWLTAFAVVNRFFQAGGWCSVVELSAGRFEASRHGTVMGIISSSYEIGNVLSLVFCSALIQAGLGWRWLFVINPLLFAAIGGACLVLLRHARRRRAASPAPAPSQRAERAPAAGAAPTHAIAPPETRRTSVLEVFVKPAFLSALALSFLLTFVRTGFLTWMPTFLSEAADPSDAKVAAGILKSAVFPAAGIVGALAAGRASDAFGPGRRGPVILVCLASLTSCVLLLGHAGIHNMRVAMAAIAGSGLFLLGPYSLVGGAVVLDVASSSRPALVSGILDSAGYVGASLSGVVLGTAAQRLGWARAFDVVAAAALAATLVSAAEMAATYVRRRARGMA